MGSVRKVTGSISLSANFTLTNTLQAANTRTSSTTVGVAQYTSDITTGVQADQANRAWELIGQEITSGNDIDINLATFAGYDIGAGTGQDGLGLPMDLQEIVTLILQHTAGTGKLEIKPSTASGWSPIGSHLEAQGGALSNGGILLKHNPGEDGFDVIPGTSQSINLKAVGGDVTFSLTIIGRNDDDESSSSSSESSGSSNSSSSSSESSSESSSS